MSTDSPSETTAASKPLLTLLNDSREDEDATPRSASQCCGGGSCSL